MKKNKIPALLLAALILLFAAPGHSAVSGLYIDPGLDVSEKNNTTGVFVDLSMGPFITPWFGAGANLTFSPGPSGFKAEDGVGIYTGFNYCTFGPELHFLAMQSWPVNFSLLVNAGLGGIGTPPNRDDAGKLDDFILVVNAKLRVNFVFWKRKGFFLGANYRRVFLSDKEGLTDRVLSGFEVSFGATVLFSHPSQWKDES